MLGRDCEEVWEYKKNIAPSIFQRYSRNTVALEANSFHAIHSY